MASSAAIALAALVLVLAPLPAGAQGPGRNGNVVDGQNRQPTPAEVLPREERAGAAATPAQAGDDQRTVQLLDRQLLGTERADPPSRDDPPPPVPPNR